jgi:carbonic anhydrase
MKTLTKELQDSITPSMALKLLEEGNKRFVNNLKANRNLLNRQMKHLTDNIHSLWF